MKASNTVNTETNHSNISKDTNQSIKNKITIKLPSFQPQTGHKKTRNCLTIDEWFSIK